MRRAGAAWLRVVGALMPLVLSACATPPTPPTTEHLEQNTEQIGRQLQALEREGFAGQVLVARGDKLLLMSGYGTMGLDDPRPVPDNAVMPLASITKAFTASGIFVLAAQGKLALEDPVGRFLEELESPWADLSIDALLTHTAGLPAEIVRRGHMDEHRFEPIDRTTFLYRVQQFEPEHREDTNFLYGNVAYGLLAALIETVSEQSWEDFLIGSVLNTAGVSEIGLLRPEWQPDELVRARDGQTDLGHWLEKPMLADGMGYNARGAGDLLARPEGVLAWWQAIRREVWLSQPWLERWLKPQVREPDGSHYGYGLHFRSSPAGPVIGHTGDDAGFTSDFSWYSDLDLMIYVNSAHVDFRADAVREHVLGELIGH